MFLLGHAPPPEGSGGQERRQYRDDIEKFRTLAMQLASVSGLASMYMWDRDMFQTLPYRPQSPQHLPPNVPVNLKNVLRQLRQVLQSNADFAAFERWGRFRRNALSDPPRALDAPYDWPVEPNYSTFVRIRDHWLSRQQTTPAQPAAVGGVPIPPAYPPSGPADPQFGSATHNPQPFWGGAGQTGGAPPLSFGSIVNPTRFGATVIQEDHSRSASSGTAMASGPTSPPPPPGAPPPPPPDVDVDVPMGRPQN